MAETHGTKAAGTPISDEMADEAERGYDVEKIRRRRAKRLAGQAEQRRLAVGRPGGGGQVADPADAQP